MKTARILVPLVLSTFFATAVLAQEAAPALVTFVTPPSGPASGGTVVIVNGSKLDLPPNFACFAPCPPRVFFGDQEATVRDAAQAQIVVVTPAYSGPTAAVDVTVRTGDGRTATLPKGFTYVSNAEAGYELWLLPIYLDAPLSGAGGSRWATDLWLRNNNTTETAQLAPWPCPDDGLACLAIFPNTYAMTPGETLHNLAGFFRPPNTSIARILYVSRNAAANVSANLRIADTSRNDLDGGTEVPIVRESDIKTGPATMHNIPVTPTSRALLRIYDLGPIASEFVVQVFPENASKDPGRAVTTFSIRTNPPESGEFRTTPGIAEFDLATRVSPNAGPVRVTVNPASSSRRYWAMVSVTNNTTNHVTLVTPQ
jgi:hypothetical protein